ncbi:MAG: hypothetical protein HRT90_07420 [Candidatus Margulisbacteria bacterium]|nr:hypothetical protein [Candidatus Margulisiibacteriota bacterium]
MKYVYIFVLMSALYLPAYSNEVSKDQIKYGALTANEEWAGDMYIIGDVTIPKEMTLTVLAGSHLYFANYDILQSGEDRHRAEILVEGTMKSLPTEDNPIRMSLMDESSLLKELERSPGTKVLHFEPYIVDTKIMRDEFRNFKDSYFIYWSLVFLLWVMI